MKYICFSNIRNSKWFFPVLLIVSASAVYFPVLGHDFLYYWDDQWQVMNQYTEGGWNMRNLWAIFTEFLGGQYSPINELLYLVIYSFSGYNPFGFHLLSLLLHAANALLIYVCMNRLLEINRKFETEHRQLTAFFTALIFALHPLNVESVAWISASKIVVYSFFYLLATLAFLSYLKESKLKYYFLTLLLFTCSFLGKEQASIFPLWALLIYWLCGYNFKDRKVWLGIIPLFACCSLSYTSFSLCISFPCRALQW